MFIITVYFTASAREVPETRSQSQTSSGLIRCLLGVLPRVSRVPLSFASKRTGGSVYQVHTDCV